jgi:fatty acid synthase
MDMQWQGMGRNLLNVEVCKNSLQKCADILMPHGFDLMKMITNNVMKSSIPIVVTQIALVDMLSSIGIYPDGILGHFLGELACAYADNAFTLEQTILSAYYRAKAIEDSKLEPDAMAAIGLSSTEVQKPCSPDITVACHNSSIRLLFLVHQNHYENL